ncbi:hypothetical protein DRW07_01735 [Alteromonas sediminis]|uniref:Uncharacterized protein n=1 Tax=Alteromonas sediminis TaxID=2259342 RepID=A0A3N5Y2L5_9ALTE|nr:hypothetical protein [Alteromonas sediminis]RPJ68157.1 hypothetical protein DRW07_01735 [Alteromonas sediminis]
MKRSVVIALCAILMACGGEATYVMATYHHYSQWEFHGNGQGDFSDQWSVQEHIIDGDCDWDGSERFNEGSS